MNKTIINTAINTTINLSLQDFANEYFKPADQDAQTAQTAAPANQQVQAIFAQLRQLPPHTPAQSNPKDRDLSVQSPELAHRIVFPATFGESVVGKAFLGLLQAFVDSDRAFLDLFKLADNIRELGYQAYSKQSAADK